MALEIEEETNESCQIVDISILSNFLGFHLKMAQAAVQRGFVEALASVDLTQRKHAVLSVVGANQHLSQVQVANALQIDRATMMSLIDRLEREGLLTRERSTQDRRRQELVLTGKGRELLDQSACGVEQFERSLAARLTPEELATTIGALRKLYDQPAIDKT